MWFPLQPEKKKDNVQKSLFPTSCQKILKLDQTESEARKKYILFHFILPSFTPTHIY